MLSFFDVGTDGAVTANHTVTRGPVSLSSIILFKGNAMGMAVRTPADGVKFIGIENELDDEKWTIKEICEFDDPGGPVSAIALDAIETSDAGITAVAALRTASGKLKIVLWRLAGNNVLQILHGDEVVTYAHLRVGSVEPEFRNPGATVNEGDRLAKAGFSGSGSSPHLHVHAVKFGADARHLSKAEIPGVINAFDTLKGPFRPLVFYGVRATSAEIKPGGPSANPEFGPVRGEGFYFDSFRVYPKAAD